MNMVFGEEPNPNTAYLTSPALLPAGRVQWLLEQQGRDRCQLAGILLWLDLIWFGNSVVGLSADPSPLDFYIIKSNADNANTSATFYDPFNQPAVPSAITEWNEDEEADGLDPYLWVHHQSQFVAGTYNQRNSLGTALGGNATEIILPPANSGGSVQPNVNVRQAWQPDVHIKTRRRLLRGDQLIFGMSAPAGQTNWTASLEVRCRVLIA
jgi:hypothetical protein